MYVADRDPLVSLDYPSSVNLCFPGADVKKEGDTTGTVFRYPSYVQHIMGDIFSLGFGPFRLEIMFCVSVEGHSVTWSVFNDWRSISFCIFFADGFARPLILLILRTQMI